MDRAIPEYNRVVFQRQISVQRKMHKERLRGMTPRIDNSKPYSIKFPINTAKKDFQIEERNLQIDKSNRLLLKKIENILLTKSNIPKQNRFGSPFKIISKQQFQENFKEIILKKIEQKRESLKLTNELDKKQENCIIINQQEQDKTFQDEQQSNSQVNLLLQDSKTNRDDLIEIEDPPDLTPLIVDQFEKQNNQLSKIKELKLQLLEKHLNEISELNAKKFFYMKSEPFSLNKISRKLENIRINMDNQSLLKRLQNRKSNYSFFEWKSERKLQVENIKRICKYDLSISNLKYRRPRNKSISNQPALKLKEFLIDKYISNNKENVYSPSPKHQDNQIQQLKFIDNNISNSPLAQRSFASKFNSSMRAYSKMKIQKKSKIQTLKDDEKTERTIGLAENKDYDNKIYYNYENQQKIYVKFDSEISTPIEQQRFQSNSNLIQQNTQEIQNYRKKQQSIKNININQIFNEKQQNPQKYPQTIDLNQNENQQFKPYQRLYNRKRKSENPSNIDYKKIQIGKKVKKIQFESANSFSSNPQLTDVSDQHLNNLQQVQNENHQQERSRFFKNRIKSRMFSQQDQRKNENDQFQFINTEQTDKKDHQNFEFKADQNQQQKPKTPGNKYRGQSLMKIDLKSRDKQTEKLRTLNNFEKMENENFSNFQNNNYEKSKFKDKKSEEKYDLIKTQSNIKKQILSDRQPFTPSISSRATIQQLKIFKDFQKEQKQKINTLKVENQMNQNLDQNPSIQENSNQYAPQIEVSCQKQKSIKPPPPIFIKNGQKSNGIYNQRKVLYRNFHEILNIDAPLKEQDIKKKKNIDLKYKVRHLVEISQSKDKKYIYVILFPNWKNSEVYFYECLQYKIFGKQLLDNMGVYYDFIENLIQIKYQKLFIKGYHGQNLDPRKIPQFHLNAQFPDVMQTDEVQSKDNQHFDQKNECQQLVFDSVDDQFYKEIHNKVGTICISDQELQDEATKILL